MGAATLTKIKIDKGIPIPRRKVPHTEFPFAEMEIGDSFFVSNKRYEKTSCIQMRGFLYCKAKEYVQQHFTDEKYSFSLERQNKGVRVFRIE